jgi:hypothetical protein
MIAQMNAMHGDAEHPAPEDDVQLKLIRPDESCGFATLCALEEWFAGYEDDLADAGYEISVYSVMLDQVRYGKKQLLFRREDSMPIRTFPMR